MSLGHADSFGEENPLFVVKEKLAKSLQDWSIGDLVVGSKRPSGVLNLSKAAVKRCEHADAIRIADKSARMSAVHAFGTLAA